MVSYSELEQCLSVENMKNGMLLGNIYLATSRFKPSISHFKASCIPYFKCNISRIGGSDNEIMVERMQLLHHNSFDNFHVFERPVVVIARRFLYFFYHVHALNHFSKHRISSV